MELLVSLIIDALFVLVLLGGASHVYVFCLWWRLPHRWSLRQPAWLRLGRWAGTLLVQGVVPILWCGSAHTLSFWGMASGAAFVFASLFLAIAAAYAHYLAGREAEAN